MTQKALTLEGLLQTLDLQNTQKLDLILPSGKIFVKNGQALIRIPKKNAEDLMNVKNTDPPEAPVFSFKILETANIHLTEKLEIGKKYYDRIIKPEHLEMFDYTLNYWLRNFNKNVLLRTFYDKTQQQGILRAMLSDKFKVIDNYDVLFAALEAVKESGVNLKIETCDLSDSRMYVRFIAPDVRVESKKLIEHYRPNGVPNDGNFAISAGFVLSNSEIGFGKFSIAARAIVGACSNGMIFEEDGFGKVHLGARMDEGNIEWSSKTKELNRELILSQTQDAIKKFISPDYLGQKIKQIEEMNVQLQHPVEAVNNVTKELQLDLEKQKSILDFFIKSGDSTSFGLSQSLTYYAHEAKNADEQYNLESAAINVFRNIKRYDFAKN